MLYPALITLIAVFVYMAIAYNVGRARVRYGVAPPAVTGNADFERYYRTQMNMLEHMAAFLPALWLSAQFFSIPLACWLGGGWIAGRICYALGYYKAPEKRMAGFIISMLCLAALLLSAIWGVGVGILTR